MLIEWEGVGIEKIIEKTEERMEDVRRWARKGSEGIGSSWVVFERSHRQDDVS
jgi:hypothetical protein